MVTQKRSSPTWRKLWVIIVLGPVTRCDGACNVTQADAGLRTIWVPGCQGKGCNATGIVNCAWCVYNRSTCDATLNETICSAYASARKAQNARCLSQQEVLMDLFKATNGQAWSWRKSTGWNYNSTYPCTEDGGYPYASSWSGIKCLGADILSLNLSSNNLSGTLPASMNSLVKLNTLLLDGNTQLSGDIFSSLRNVGVLYEDGLNLKLSNVRFTGSLPQDFWSWGQLRAFEMSGAGLTGTLPKGPVKAQLTNLALSNNKLQGPIPAEMFSLVNLTQLSMDHNELTGTLPKEIGQIAHCTVVQLQGNRLKGPVPSELGLLQRAQNFDFRFNSFTGTLPAELADLQFLQGLYFSYNHLTGTIPSQLGQYIGMWRLGLDHNRFRGSIPPMLMRGGTRQQLQYLDLSYNFLTGSVPPTVTKMQFLSWLFLGHNKLSGTIPSWDPDDYYPNVYPRVLDLHENKLTGSMPEHLPKSVTFVDVRSNNMNGVISPSTFTPLSNLQFLMIADNDFTGSFPQLPSSQAELKVLAHANFFSCKVSPSGPNVTSDVILAVPGSLLEVPLPEWYVEKDPLAAKKNLLNDPTREFKEFYIETGILVGLAILTGIVYRKEYYRFLFSNAKPDLHVDRVSSTLAAMLGLQSIVGAALLYLYTTSQQRYTCGRPLGTISATYITGDSLTYVAGLWALVLPATFAGIWHTRASVSESRLQQVQAAIARRTSRRRGNGGTTSLTSVDESLEDGNAAVEREASSSSVRNVGAPPNTPRSTPQDTPQETPRDTPVHSDRVGTISHRSHASHRTSSSWASDIPSLRADTCCKRITMWLLWMLAVLVCAAPGVLYAFGSAIPLTEGQTKFLNFLPVIAAVMTSLVQPTLAKTLGKMQARREHTIDHTRGRLLASAGLITWVGPMVIVIFMSENCGGYWWNFYDKCDHGSAAFDFCDSKIDPVKGNIIGCAVTTKQVCGTRWIALERCTMSIMDVLVPLLLSKLLAAISLSLGFLLLCKLLGGETSINVSIGRRRILHYDVLANFREAQSMANLTIFGDIGLAWAPICPLIAVAGFCYVYTLRLSNALTKNAFGREATRWSQASPAFSRVYLFSGVIVSCGLMICHLASAGDDRPFKTAGYCLGAAVLASAVVLAVWRLQPLCAQRGGEVSESNNGARAVDCQARNMPLLTENPNSIASEHTEQKKTSFAQQAEEVEQGTTILNQRTELAEQEKSSSSEQAKSAEHSKAVTW